MRRRIPLLDPRREHAEIAGEIEGTWRRVLDDMHLLGGNEGRAFECEIAAYIGSACARGVGSGSDALLLGMAALGIGKGDRVVIPANAFVAALEAAHHLGAEPVVIDTVAEGFGPDLGAIGAALPARAVVVVHLYGHAFDAPAIRALCTPHGALLLEDGSHAHGARRGAARVGAIGDVGCFSAGVVKNLGAYGDAGFVTTSDAAVARAVELLRSHGQRSRNDHVLYGYNSRLDELQAAVLRVKLRRLDERNRRRRSIAAYYADRLAGVDVRLPVEEADEHAVYHQYVLRSDRRDDLRRHLERRGIESGVHYPVPLHRQPAWIQRRGDGARFPNAELLARSIVSIPVFPDLNDAEVEDVAGAVRSFFTARTALPAKRVERELRARSGAPLARRPRPNPTERARRSRSTSNSRP